MGTNVKMKGLKTNNKTESKEKKKRGAMGEVVA
jgi:hypothetical protein